MAANNASCHELETYKVITATLINKASTNPSEGMLSNNDLEGELVNGQPLPVVSGQACMTLQSLGIAVGRKLWNSMGTNDLQPTQISWHIPCSEIYAGV